MFQPYKQKEKEKEKKCKLKIKRNSDGSVSKEITGSCSKEELNALSQQN